MAFEVDMTTFWGDWGVACGNQSANNRYDCFYGLTMTDGYVCSNATDFFNWNSTNRYEFYHNYDAAVNNPPQCPDEFTFYTKTNDVNIYDFKTFYEIAPSYFPAQCVTSNNFVIAFRSSPTYQKSFDGINWTAMTTDVLTSYQTQPNCNAANTNYILMGGINNIVRYNISSDTWENFTQSITFNDICYNVNNDVFVGITRGTTTNNVHLSTDNGETWTTHSSDLNFDCIDYRYNSLSMQGNKYYASINTIGAERVATSMDGITWTTYTSSTGGAATTDSRYFDTVEDGTGYIWFIPSKPSASNDKYVLRTYDFSSWDQYNYFATGGDWRNVSMNPNDAGVVLMGEPIEVSSYQPFVSLSQSNAPTTYRYTDSCYYNDFNVFIAVSSSAALADTTRKILYSTDGGDNWTKVPLTPGTYSNVFVVNV